MKIYLCKVRNIDVLLIIPGVQSPSSSLWSHILTNRLHRYWCFTVGCICHLNSAVYIKEFGSILSSLFDAADWHLKLAFHILYSHFLSKIMDAIKLMIPCNRCLPFLLYKNLRAKSCDLPLPRSITVCSCHITGRWTFFTFA